MMQKSWTPPQNYRNRPVVILGAGVLGRRIGQFSLLLGLWLEDDS